MSSIRKYRCKIGISAAILVATLFLSACAGGVSQVQSTESGNVTIPPEETMMQDTTSAEEVVEETEVQEQEQEQEQEEMGSSGDSKPAVQTVSKSEGFYYELLSEEGKIWYRDMLAIMTGMGSEQDLSTECNGILNEKDIETIFGYVLDDHPELFYVKGYTYTIYTMGEEILRYTFSGSYTMDSAERERRQALIDEVVNNFLAGVVSGASDYDKVKYVYEYVIRNTEYDQSASDNQNICSVFLNHRSVCQGYAKATQYLLNKMGIETTLVIGSVGSESHAWNLVKVDGDYYYVDTTWGDASYQFTDASSVSSASMPEINYDYLCITTDQLLLTHLAVNQSQLPPCTATAANYYVHEGAYFTEYDEKKLAEIFDRGYDEGKKCVTFRCSDSEVYQTYLTELIGNQKVFNYLNNVGGAVAYSQDDAKFLLTFWLVNE